MPVRETRITALESVSQFLVVNAHGVQDRGIEIVDVDWLVEDVAAQVSLRRPAVLLYR